MAAVNHERPVSDRSSTLGDRVRTLALCCNRVFPKDISGTISAYYKDLLLEEALQDMEHINKVITVGPINHALHDDIRIESVMTHMRCFYSIPRVYEQFLFFCRVHENRIRRVDNPERWLELIIRGATYHIDDFGLFRDLVNNPSELFLFPA